MDRSFQAIVLIVLLSFSIIDVVSAFPEEDSKNKLCKSRSSGPILINGDQELENTSTFLSWQGNGTKNDPYIMEGMTIDGMGGAFCLHITNTASHLMIRNCNFANTSISNNIAGTGSAIFLDSMNVMITSNSISKSGIGIRIDPQSSDLNITDNTISGCGYGLVITGNGLNKNIYGNIIKESTSDGIHLDDISNLNLADNNISTSGGSGITLNQGRDNTFRSNQLYLNEESGIRINHSFNNRFYSNEMTRTGIFLMQEMYGDPNIITTNNTINGRSIHFFSGRDLRDVDLPKEGGQIIFESCSYGELKGSNISHTYYPIQMAFCNQMIVKNCHLMDILGCSITMVDSESVIIEDCTLENCNDGIITKNDQGVIYNQAIFIQDNTFSEIEGSALVMNGGIGNKVLRNVVDQAGVAGFHLTNTKNTTVISNLISNSGKGVHLSHSDSIRLMDNAFYRCDVGLLEDSGNGCSSIYNNIFSENTGYSIHLGPFCSGDRIYSNIFSSNNGVGVDLDPNQLQVKDEGCLGMWYHEDGYGNYWSDMICPDSNKDGMVDHPYPISDDCKDEFSLVNHPFEHIARPGNLKVTSGNGFVNMEWTEPVRNMDSIHIGYRIYRENETETWDLIKELGPEVHSYNDTKIENDVDYWYSIRSVNRFGEGGRSGPWHGTPDGQPPLIEIIYPKDGTYIDSVHFNVKWNCSDNASGIGSLMVQLDNFSWVPLDVGKKTHLFSLVSEGSHVIRIHVVDNVGNQNSQEVHFIVDIDLPCLEIEVPARNGYEKGPSINLTWKGWDVTSGIRNFDIRLDNETWLWAGTGQYFIISDLDMGHHWIDIRATDQAGNIQVEGVPFEIDYISPDIHIIEPINGSRFNRDNLLLRWGSSDIGSRIGETRVYFNMELVNRSENGLELFMDDLQHGWYEIRVEVEDLAGNLDVETVIIMIDLVSPTISPINPLGSNVALDSNITFSLSEPMDWSTVMVLLDGAQLDWYRDGLVISADRDVGLSFGRTYKVAVVGRDLAGNEIEEGTWSFGTDFNCSVIVQIINEKGSPLPGARLTFNTGEGFIAGPNGNVTFTVPSGDYGVTLSMEGYKERVIMITLLPGVLNELDPIVLERNEEKMDGILSGTGKGHISSGLLVILVISLILISAILIILILIMKRRNNGLIGEKVIDPFEEVEQMRYVAAIKGIDIATIESDYKRSVFLRNAGRMEEADMELNNYKAILREYIAER